jgi:hypothetical protein
MAEFDTAALVESIRTRGQIPTAGDWTDTKILEVATEELRSSIVPSVLSVREGYYDEVVDFAFSTSLPRYRIPSWAIGQKLGGVYYVPATSTEQPCPLDLVSEKQLQSCGLTDTRPLGYIIRGNVVIPFPAPGSGATGKVRLKIQARPSALVLPTTCGVGFVQSEEDLEGDFAAAGFVDGQRVDVVQSTPGFENVVRSAVLHFTSTSGSLTLDFYSKGDTHGTDVFMAGGPTAGAFPTLTPEGKTCFPQCPTEFWYILAQTVAVRYLQDQGFLDELRQAQQELVQLRTAAMPTITPRGGEDTKRFRNNRLLPGR